MHRRWLPAMAVAALLLAASVVPPGPAGGGSGPLPLDKLLHSAGYAALAGTLIVALKTSERSAERVAALSFCGAVGYGVAIELVQAGVPYRTASLADAGANALGALVGAAIAAAVRSLTDRKA